MKAAGRAVKMRNGTKNKVVALAGAMALVALFSSVSRAARDNAPEHVLIIDGFKQSGDFAMPMSVYFDEKNSEIYMTDQSNGRVCVFTEDGMPVAEYTKFKESDNFTPFQAPLDVAVDSEGVIFVSDTQLGRVIGMDFQGNMLVEIDFSKAEKVPVSPTRITIDSEDNLFILDGNANQVLVYTTKGRFRYKFGKQQGGVTGIQKASNIYADRENSLVYVTSYEGTAVLVFDYDGFQILSFGQHDSGESNFSLPTGIVATPDGTIYVADMLRSDIKRFDAEGRYKMHFGGVGKSGAAIIFPADIHLSRDGRLFFAEKTSKRIHVFKILPEVKKDEE